MADLKISQLSAITGAELQANDLLALADLSASETKKVTVKDLIEGGVLLIDDESIPAGKIEGGISVSDGSITSAKIADDAVEAVHISDNSVVVVAASLPASGGFIGQVGLTTSNNKLYVWTGASWVSIKAAGSINSVTGSGTGLVPVAVSTTGDTATVSASLANTTAAGQFLAGPTGASGAISRRTIASTDLPTATTAAKGAVSVNGSGLTLSGDQVVIDNTVTASATASLVTYNNKGLVTGGQAITSADLPIATDATVGAVKPGSGLVMGVGGNIDHSNVVAGATATKVTYNTQGHITASASLEAADIPEIPASKITSGTFSASLYGNNTITGAKLANESTVVFGGSGSTAGVVTFPTAEFKGQYFYDELNQDLYIWSGSAWLPVTIISGELVFAGTYDASVNQVDSVTSAGSAVGLTTGSALPAASTSNNRYYLVVSQSGTGTGNAPAEALAPPDMILSNGSTWELIDVSNAIAGQTASNISFTPYGDISAINVQLALQELNDEKIGSSNPTFSGNVNLDSTAVIVFEGSTADDYETTLTCVDPTADRTITIPDVTGTVITSGDTATVTNTMLAGSIADTKLSSITTANKIAISAIDIDGATDIGVALADADEIIVDDGGAGVNRKAAVTRISDYTFNKVSGDITIASNGTAAIGSGVIVNADINASAAIAGSKIQAATTSNAGAVQLSSSTSSTSTTTAATPSAVKSAYDLADAALPKSGGTMTGDIVFSATQTFPGSAGVTSVTATSPLASSGGATPNLTIQDGTTSQKGAVQLSSSTSSTSTTTAATSSSVKSAYDLANAALPKSGGTMSGTITFAGAQTFPGTLTSASIGVTVQAYDADTAKYDATTANFTGTLQNGGSNVLVDSDIGVNVQAYDADTAKYDAATANFTGTLQNGGSNVLVDTDIGSTVQAYDADTAKYDDTTANFTGTLQNGGSNVLVDSDIGSTVQAYDADTAKLDVAQTFTAVQTLTDPAIVGTILEDVYTISDGAAFEVDPGNGSVQLITLGANRTPKATNFAAGEAVTLMINDGTAYTLTWTDTTWGTSGVVWTGGSAPTLATTGYTVVQFWKVGSQVYGAYVGDVA